MAEKLKKRPVLHLPLTSTEKILEVVSGVGVLFIILVPIYYEPILPDAIPQHFGASGKADAWGGKGNLLVLPIVGIAMYALLTVISRYPQTWNLPFALTEENVERQYRSCRMLLSIIKVEIVWLFAYIGWRTIQTALGEVDGLGQMFLPVFLIVMTGTLVIYFYRAGQAR
ncbi:MAG: DUF1648 domain-containing protein [Gemmatimonadetes bacterium]|jgi:uncharacterized membrane protein|nr:DUF1648 domain-containing protein [Gemmatimonadota bacterium]